MKKDILITFALKEESANLFDEYNVLYTGVGKINACMELLKKIHSKKPKIVINIGTSGSRKFPSGVIVNPTRFVQRDVDATSLGFQKYEIPFSEIPIQLNNGMRVDSIEEAICGTGDNFSTKETYDKNAYDIVDMEAFALAQICRDQNINFLCLKYISDGADGNAHIDWHQCLNDSAEKTRNLLETVVFPFIESQKSFHY